jgi:DNA-binding GntR family transcriptional regulator
MYGSLFTRSRAALLTAIFADGQPEFPVRQLVRIAGGSSAGVQRMLRDMQRDGLIRVRRAGNSKMISANVDSPLYEVLKPLAQALVRRPEAVASPAFFERFQKATRRRDQRDARALGPAAAQADAALRFGRARIRDLSFSSFAE